MKKKTFNTILGPSIFEKQFAVYLVFLEAIIKRFYSKKLYARIMIIFVFLYWNNSVLAQISKPLTNIQSPNVASLELNGVIPVSKYTGTPSISIPLYNLNIREINVPVQLNYQADGFRPDMHPGWVGMGWSLESGGVISRAINDLPDETTDVVNPSLRLGYYFNREVLNNSNWNQTAFMHGLTTNNYGNATVADTEPDAFSFSFAGYSGKFFLNADGNWKVKCDKPVKVVFNNEFLSIPNSLKPPAGSLYETNGFMKSFSGFTLITEDGTSYIFGGTTDAIEYSIPFFRQNSSQMIANCWYLTKIVHKDGYRVILNYERGNFISQMFNNINSNLSVSMVPAGGSLVATCSNWENVFNSLTYYKSYQGELVSPVYLTSIGNGSTNIYFDRSDTEELKYNQSVYQWKYEQLLNNGDPESPFTFKQFPYIQPGYPTPNTDYPDCLKNLIWKKLDRIRIEENSLPLKSFEFIYGNNSTQRLRLDNVVEKAANDSAKPPYSFIYDNSNQLPDYLANMSDHWGFYNGNYANISSINNVTTYFGSREPVGSYLMAGTLNKVIYPTGGMTEYYFEPHYYSSYLNENRSTYTNGNNNLLAGGLRIKKIISYPSIGNSNNKLEKEYFYVKGFHSGNTISSGVLGGQSKYYFNDYRTHTIDKAIIYSQEHFSSSSVLPGASNIPGSHIGYSEVTEKSSDGSYNIFLYTNFDNGHLDETANNQGGDNILQLSRTAYEPYSSIDQERGKLFYEYNYSTQGTLLRYKTINYVALNKSTEFAKSLKIRFFGLCASGYFVEEGTAYRFYTYSYLPSKETTVQYDLNGQNGFTTISNYTYNNYRLLASKEQTDSKGANIKTIYKYPFDINSNPNAISGVSPTSKMIKQNYLPIMEQTSYIQKTPNNPLNNYILSSNLTKYGIINIKDALNNNISTVVPIQDYALEEPSEVNDIYTSFQEIENFQSSNYSEVIDSKLKLKVNYNYNDYGNIAQVSPYNVLLDSKKTSYQWGYNQRFPTVVVKSASFNEFYYEGFEEPLLSQWGISNFPLGSHGALINHDTNIKRSGEYSGRIDNTVSGQEIVSHSNKWLNISLAAPKKFHYAGWVYSNGSSADICLLMKRAGEQNYFSYINSISTNLTNQWVYLEKDFEVPQDVTSISIRVDAKTLGSVWFDDLRLHPSESQMTTYTYAPMVGITSETDPAGRTIFYEYDLFKRLMTIKDKDGYILKHFEYNYKTQ